jgi:hypothetical protein
MPSPYGIDRFIGAFEIIEGTNESVFVESGGSVTEYQVDPQWLYPYLGPVVGLTNPVKQLSTVYTLINSLPGISPFTFGNVAPTNSPQSLTGGLSASSAGSILRLDLMHESWRPCFGVLPGDLATTVVDGFVSPYSLGYQTVFPKRAAAKLPDVRHEQYRAGRGRRRTQVRFGSEFTREAVYHNVPAGLVRATRAAEHACWAEYAGLGLGDVNPNFANVWSSWSQNVPGIIVHNEGFMDSQVATHPFEIVLLGDSAMDQFSSLWPEIDEGGEFYDITLPLIILRSFYEHD